MATKKTATPAKKRQAQPKRPRCLHCTSLLAAQVKRGQTTGKFGRYGDGFFCDQLCGYQYGVKQAKAAAKLEARSK